jgi:signal transduction histidine kinase/CHASE2 domain-containing sensor protein
MAGRQRASWGMAMGFITAIFTLLLLHFHPIGSKLENDTLDFWFGLHRSPPSGQVAIISIDDATIQEWNGRMFNERDIGRLMLALKQNRVRAAALALPQLETSSWRYERREAFAKSLRSSGIAYLPLGLRGSSTSLALSDEQLRTINQFALPGGLPAEEPDEPSQVVTSAPTDVLRAAQGAGHTAFGFDAYGRARKYFLALPFAGKLYPSLSYSMASGLGEAPKTLSPRSREGALFNFPEAPQSTLNAGASPFLQLSLASILKAPQQLQQLAGRSVFIGVTAPGYTPYYTVPDGRRVPEVELHAVALDNELGHTQLKHAPFFWLVLLTVLSCVIVGGFVAARSPLWSAIVAMLLLGAMFTLSIGLFSQHIWLNISAPWMAIGLTFLTGVIARARRETREATHIGSTIEALTQVSEVITAQTHSSELLDRVLQWTVRVMKAEGASALLLDETGTKLHFAATTGPVAKELMPFTLNVGEGIAGWVCQSGEPIVVNDVRRDSRFNHNIDEAIGFTTRSILCLPLRVRDKMLGVVEVVNRLDGSPFTEDDIDLLAAVANQSAVVLDNARLYAILNERVVQSESELAHTNRRLEAEKTLLQTVLQSMTDGVVVTDHTGRIQLVNPTAAQLLPELGGEVEGHLLTKVLPECAEPAQPGRRSLNGLRSFQILRGDIDSPRIIEASSAPLNSENGSSGTVTVFADVTEERNIEQAKSDFVSFVAHEMRSPLTTISGFSSMLQRAESQRVEAADGAKIGEGVGSGTLPQPSLAQRARFLGLIHDESERLTRLINSLLDVARIEAGQTIELHRETFDFAPVAQAAVDSQRAYSSRHHIVCHFADALPPIHADRDKVTQILINLLSNALKYSPGGTVTVSAEPDAVQPTKYLQVRVRDEGPGMAPEQQAMLFQRFGRSTVVGPGQRAKPTGTGLGLFLTKHLVERHGGQIYVESQTEMGSTFVFTLPVAPQSGATKSATTAATSAA